jgi:hypothetical protein
VTTAAVSSEIAIVNIVAVMAIDTLVPAAPGRFQRAVVASMAMQSRMRALQRKIRFIVIELPDQPVIRVMALPAILPQRLLMHIVLPVAVDTLAFSIVKT